MASFNYILRMLLDFVKTFSDGCSLPFVLKAPIKSLSSDFEIIFDINHAGNILYQLHLMLQGWQHQAGVVANVNHE